VTCPGGHTVQGSTPRSRAGQSSRKFEFPAVVCAACPLRPQCVKGKGGRTITVHPQEALLQRSRAYEATDEFREDVIRRQVVEHRIARLAQLGIRKSRFFGRQKTKFQLLMASAVANLTLVWGKPAAADESDAEPAPNMLCVARFGLHSALAGAIRRIMSRPAPRAGFANAARAAA